MEEDDEKPHLPMDIVMKIPAHISDPATLARAASSHKLWRALIKDSATFLDGLRRRHADHGFTSSLLLGFFFQERSEAPSHLWQHHEDKTRCLAPSFMPTSEFLGSGKEGSCNAANNSPMSLGTFLQGTGASLNFYRPVASQDSFLALRDRRSLRVCNPLSGQEFLLPYRRDAVPPQHYVLLVTDDVGAGGRVGSQSFRLVSIWIKGREILYKYYCSNTGAWLRPENVPELMPGHYLTSSPAAASRGDGIHWLCGSWKTMAPTHVCTLSLGQEELSYIDLPPEATQSNKARPALLVASSADGGILLLLLKGLQMLLWRHKANDASVSSWVLSETIDLTGSLPVRLRMVPHRAKLKLEVFRGKSGAVVVWIEGEGLYLLCLSDRSMRKLDSEHVTKRYFLCPYEIDWLSCLAVTNLVVHGSLNAERTKIHARWRTLMAESIASTNNTLA